MQNKLIGFKEKMELRLAEKKGAASIETILVSAVVIALAVMLIVGFSTTVKDADAGATTGIETAVGNNTAEIGSLNGTNTP